MLTEHSIQQSPTTFMLDVCDFEPVLSNREILGNFNVIFSLQPVNNTATNYQIEVVFQVDIGANATFIGLTPNGTEHALCITLQYFGYKPASALTTLTVEPQSTQRLTANKTPEQLQAEAQQNGWLSFWHEWSWWYPWYRLHFVLNITLPPYGVLYIDYGWSPLPFGMSFQANNTVLGLILNDLAEDFTEDFIISTIAAFIIKRIAAGWFGKTIGGMVAAVAMYLAFSVIEIGYKLATSGNTLKTWLMAFLSSALACFLDLMIHVFDTLQFLTTVARRIVGAISHTLNSMWARGLNFFDITGIIFNFVDFGLMVFYLLMYKNSLV